MKIGNRRTSWEIVERPRLDKNPGKSKRKCKIQAFVIVEHFVIVPPTYNLKFVEDIAPIGHCHRFSERVRVGLLSLQPSSGANFRSRASWVAS